MPEYNDRVYIVANYWQWKPLALLSLLIRIVCYGYNHVAFEINGEVHEMVGSSFRWTIKKLLGRPVSYEANKGCGYKRTPLAEWLRHSDRRVTEMRSKKPLKVPAIKQGYGFLDLVQKLFHIVRRRWLLIGNDWNGTDGTKLWEGNDCSEFFGLAIEEEKPHLLDPLAIRLHPNLEFVQEFETRKQTT